MWIWLTSRFVLFSYKTSVQISRQSKSLFCIFIEGISSFSAQTMDYNLDFYFYQVSINVPDTAKNIATVTNTKQCLLMFWFMSVTLALFMTVFGTFIGFRNGMMLAWGKWNLARFNKCLMFSHNGSGPVMIRDREIFKKIWHPDVYFANARSASFQEITEPNFLVWIYPNGWFLFTRP